MAEDTVPNDEPATERVVIVRTPLWQRIVRWTLIMVVALALLVLGLALGINTDPGRRFLAGKIGGFTTASGLNIQVGRIDGSIYGAMVLHDVRVRDTRGVFASSPQIAVDWRPFAYLRNHVDVRSLTSPLVRFDRTPALKAVPSDPNAPTLPDLDIDIGRLNVARIEIGEAVTGQRQTGRLAGTVHIADRRAQLMLDGGTLGRNGGDAVALKLDAVPDDDKFDVDLKLNSPARGLVTTMAGLEAPLAVAVTGRGSWKNWNGRALASLGGGQLADLAVEARNGTFRVRGPTQPGLWMKGPVERLASPRLDVALDATLQNRRADTRLALRSSALAVMSQGTIDLGTSRFENFRTEAMLLTPGSIAPNLNGRSVRAQVALDGPFATPTVDYKLAAASLGFGATVVEQLYAEGRATVNSDRILVPVRARAKRVAGLNAAVGGLVTNVSIGGDIAISGDQILSDNLKIRSDRVNATAIVVADMSTGRYSGALKGRINNYRVEGVGIVNVDTDAELFAAPGGGWGIRGRVAAKTARIFNDGVREFLGGNAYAAVRLSLDPNGIVDFNRLRVNAPDFRVTNGSGRYDPKGAILVNADAWSRQYGPLTARVTGTLTEPAVLLRASRPGLGVGLNNLVANIRGDNGAYAVRATGGTDYGPFSANVLVRTGGSLAVDVRSARFAGVDLHGRIQQTAPGPFAGRLDFSGSGLNGNVRLANQAGVQRADVNARAYQARIPGRDDILIGRAIVDASVVMYARTPSIVADAQVANFRSGELVVTQARAKVNYRGGSGAAQLFAAGSSGVPFRVGANARLSPELWLVALQGQGSGINFKTVNPARIQIARGTYRLLPTRLDFDRGSARIAGSYGSGMTLQTRLDRLDIAIANAFVPGLGLGGSATGSIDFAQPASGGMPTANARIDISNFTRSSLAAVSTPVNLTLAGRLVPDGGDLRALIRRGATPVGRMVATLRPLGAGGSWSERLQAAPLSGGIRYNGPAGVLFSLAALSDQQLEGPIGVAADFSGRLSAPQLTGVVRANNLTYDNESFGTRLTNMRIDGRFTNDRFEIVQMNAKAGDGTVSAQGSVGLAAASGFPIDIRADFKDAQLARSDALGATASGSIRVTNSAAEGGRISGKLVIPEARYEIIRQGSAEVPELTGVRRKSDAARAQALAEQIPARRATPPGLFKLDLDIDANNRLYVSGMGLESEWLANLHVGGTSANPVITGEARVVRGTYSFAGKRFDLTRGQILFEGGNLTNPQLAISATTTTEGITAIINISGSAQAPRVAFTSSPALPQDEVMSRLLFGSNVTNLSATEALQLAAALNSLRGSGGGLNPLGKLRSVAGIDRLRILGADDTSGRGTALAAGKYITDDIYVEIVTDARGFTATQIEFALSKALSVLSQTGSFGGSSVSVRYSKDY